MPYFFDSYAIIEMFQQAPNFGCYTNEKITITLLNLIEIAYYFHTNFGEDKARKVCDTLRESVIAISNEDIIQAVKFRHQNRKKSLSYADSVGYIYALSHGLVFLTGDDAFKSMPNVEFVK